MLPKDKFATLDSLAFKCNIAAFKREFNSLSKPHQIAYGKSLSKNNSPFKDAPAFLAAFKRGLYLMDRSIYMRIYAGDKENPPLSMKLLDLENWLTGAMMSISDNDKFLKMIAKLISERDDEIKIMEFVKKVDEDLYRRILANLPDAKKATEGVPEITNNKNPKDNDDNDDNDDDFENDEDEENPFAGSMGENYSLLQSQYNFKAEALSIYYEELKRKNLPSHIIESLVLMESSILDSLVGRS